MIERWQGPARRYLYPGDGYKYWAMTDDEPQSRVINRMRVEDDIERLRREGQIILWLPVIAARSVGWPSLGAAATSAPSPTPPPFDWDGQHARQCRLPREEQLLMICYPGASPRETSCGRPPAMSARDAGQTTAMPEPARRPWAACCGRICS